MASVSPKNSLHAQYLDVHLLLTFINQNDTELEMENLDDEVEEFEQVFGDIQEVEGNETLHLNSGDSDVEKTEEEGEKDWFNGPVNSMMEEEKDTSNLKECYTYPSLISQSLPQRQDVADVILAHHCQLQPHLMLMITFGGRSQNGKHCE
ncbi:hypothetical protein BC332_28824 [Capsicum chinense]|nr:hypothetical protein BC332_28824 [Capsicum chinense]